MMIETLMKIKEEYEAGEKDMKSLDRILQKYDLDRLEYFSLLDDLIEELYTKVTLMKENTLSSDVNLLLLEELLTISSNQVTSMKIESALDGVFPEFTKHDRRIFKTPSLGV